MENLQPGILHLLASRKNYIDKETSYSRLISDPLLTRLAPALYLLARQGTISVPEDVLQQLQKHYWSNKARWLMRKSQLEKILPDLEGAGVEVIPLKGAAFIGTLYQDVGLRTMSDIDLLVQPQDLLRVARILEASGFTACLHAPEKTLDGLESLPPTLLPNEISMAGPSGLQIDIHQALVSTWFRPAYRVDMPGVWERSVPCSAVENTKESADAIPWKRRLSPEDTLAYLCLHEALHGMQITNSTLDADLFIRSLSADWDWDGFIKIVNQWRIRSAAYHTLHFCRDFMDTPLPDDLLRRLDPGWLARLRVRGLIGAESLLADKKTLGRRYPTLVKLALIDRVPDIIKTLLHLAFPPKEFYQQNASRGSLLANWRHIMRVVRRGD